MMNSRDNDGISQNLQTLAPKPTRHRLNTNSLFINRSISPPLTSVPVDSQASAMNFGPFQQQSSARPASMHEPWYLRESKTATPSPPPGIASKPSVMEELMASGQYSQQIATGFPTDGRFQQQKQPPTTFIGSVGYQEDLNRIQEWFKNLPVSDAIFALQSVISSLPYPISPSALISQGSSGMSALSEASLIGKRPSSFHFDSMGDFSGFHSPNLSPSQSPRPRNVGVIGQNRPAHTPDLQEREDNHRYSFRSSSADISKVARIWQTPVSSAELESSRLKQSQTYSLEQNHRRYLSNPPSHAPPSPPQFHNRQRSTPSPQHFKQVNGQKIEAKGKVPEKISYDLLADIPAWLRSLRLHKYTHLFWPDPTNPESTKKKWTYREMIMLSDQDLESLGVGALGARRKMLRMFEVVKKQMLEDGLLKPEEIPQQVLASEGTEHNGNNKNHNDDAAVDDDVNPSR